MSAAAARQISVGFKMDGAWLADFARTRVLEERWDHAVRTLQCLDGINTDQVLAILRGDATLNGDSSDPEGVGFVPDDDADYKRRLDWLYGGVWNNNGRFMRPYAIVTAWGPDDMVGANAVSHLSGKRRYRYVHTSIYYADDPVRDVVHRCEVKGQLFRKTDVLWKEVTNFPHLLVDAASNSDAQSALDAYMTVGRGHLDERGYMGGRERSNLVDDLLAEVTVNPDKLEVERTPEVDEKESDKVLEASRAAARETIEKIVPGFGYAKLIPDLPTDLELAEMGAKIRAAAGDQWIDLAVEGREPVRIPRAPFENWCLWRGDGAHLALPWTPIAPSGLKMMGDDPYHTDFMLGAGLDLDAMRDHNGPLSRAIWDLRREVQANKLGFKVAVLCGTGTSPTLKAVHPKRDEACKPDEVAIIPNAGPHYVAAAMSAGAVICERGGAMAHLVTVSRAQEVKIVRVEDARKLYPVGMHLVVDCIAGDVHVPYNRIDHMMKIGGMLIDVDDLDRGGEE